MLSIMKMSVYLVETAVSDLFLVSHNFLSTHVMLIRSHHQLYHCYIVWEANSAILTLPIVLYVADIGKIF